jgi:hypothetical protein
MKFTCSKKSKLNKRVEGQVHHEDELRSLTILGSPNRPTTIVKMHSKDTSICSSQSDAHFKRISANNDWSFKWNQNSMHKFYITRLKHSLIISFLFLIPIQNIFLFLIIQFAEKVRIFVFK